MDVDAGGLLRPRVPWLASLALLAGLAARLALALTKPVWADEIFTLTLARRSAGAILEALRVDSGPPLHYLLSRLVLLPFPAPGPADVVVRLLSVLAAVLHVPLLIRCARRAGVGDAWSGAALWALFPVAVAYGAEGRGYALASLFALAAFERLQALRESPSPSRAIAVGLLAAAAVLTHYLAAFPLLGMALAFARDVPGRRLVLAGGVGLAAVGPWIPIALSQPRASMAWVVTPPFTDAAARLLPNAVLGIDATGATSPFLLAAAVIGVLLLVLGVREGDKASSTVLAGLAAFFLAGLAVPQILLPERGAVLFLPLIALALSRARRPAAEVAAATAAVFLLLQSPGWTQVSPGTELAARLAPSVRAGAGIVAVGFWGPELSYLFARDGLQGTVTWFPSDVTRHPGWYAEEGIDEARLAAEAREAVRAGRGERFFVLPIGSRASAELQTAIEPLGAVRVGRSPVTDVYRLRVP